MKSTLKLLAVALSGVALLVGWGIHQHKESMAAERQRQELARAEHARTEAALTIHNAHDFFAAGKWDEAAIWCEKAAKAGDVLSQNHWGECLEKGLGVKADAAETVKWYRKTAATGDPVGKFHLAGCLYHGVGVDQDVAAALPLYQEAAAAGQADAQSAMGEILLDGKCLLEGIGVSPSKGLAKYWFQQAAQQGSEEAKKLLKTIE